jgi:hypothetical protein
MASDAGFTPGIGATDTMHIRCGDLVCVAPALCVASVDATRCRCPIGYIDARGDGSDCRDVNECVIPGICDRGGKCTNVPGSYQCECAAPALVALGNICVCASGYTRTGDAACLAQDGVACESDAGCLNHHCEGGTCCAVHCDRPDECHTSEAASCKDGKTCTYRAVADGTACDDARSCTVGSVCDAGKCTAGRSLDCDDKNPCTDDSCDEQLGCRNVNHRRACDDANPCTLNDACAIGECGGDAKRCEAGVDACNVGSCNPETGECGSAPRPDGTLCDDGDSCSASDACSGGRCNVLANSCGPHASACSSGQPNQCTCEPGFVDNTQGRCVAENDECAAQSVCAPDATCDDPSSASGDVTCACKPGFSGDGRSCSPIDACANNPCGAERGSCTDTGAGTYSCTCAAGYVAAQGSCACDLTGTFAVRTRIELSWSGMQELVESGSDAVYGYAIEHLSYDAAGNLVIEHSPCGDGAFDLCGIGSPPTIAPESYAPYIPANVWDLPSMPKPKARVHNTLFVPGGEFETDVIAHLQGIGLNDPLGPWPSSLRDIAGTPEFDGSAVNGARWLDHDDDGFVGLTTFLVPPGGIQGGMDSPLPPRSYGASSPVCPRDGGPHTPYAYLPAPADGSTTMPVRVKRFYSAFRAIASYKGTLVSCDEMSGKILGQDSEQLTLDMRVGGCIRAHEQAETACSDSAIEFLDTAAQLQRTATATFQLKRWPSDAAVSCSAARALAYE